MTGPPISLDTTSAAKDWPPLITTAVRPAWVIWRDRALTVLMWSMFGLLLQSEFQFLADRVYAFTDFEETPDPHWRYFWQLLWPFMRVSAWLILGLFVAGLLSLFRGRRARRLPQPPRLSLTDEADAKGLSDDALREARLRKIAIVHIGDDGRYRIDAAR